MSTEATPRSAPAIAFIVAGAAVLISLALFATEINIDTRIIYIISFLAMAAGLFLLARTEIENGTAKTAAYFAALGWFLLAVASVIPVLPGIVSSSAYFVIALASIVAGAVVASTRQLTPYARVAFVALMAAVTLYMATAFLGFIGPLAALLTILVGIGAVLTGYFIQTRR